MKKIVIKILGLVVVSTLFIPSISACANEEKTSTYTNEEETGWKELASMPTARSMFESEVIDGKIYTTGGSWNNDYEAPTEVYDPFTNKWTKLASMPTARVAFQTAVIGDKMYIIGGKNLDNMELVSSTEVYDSSTNKWTKLASMPTARVAFQTAVIGDKMYIIGGKNLDNMELVSSTEVYDSSTNKWTTLAPMPVVRDPDDFRAEVVDGKIYIIGNIPDGTCTAITEVYDPSTDSWVVLTPMTTPRSGFQTEVIDGKIYVIGGYSGRFIIGLGCNCSIDSLSSAEVYDPSNDKWTALASLSTARCWLQTEVINGKIYAIGGLNNKVGDSKWNPVSSAEVYDPSTNTWTTLASASKLDRIFQTEVVDDKIYAIGGLGMSTNNTDNGLSSEVYDPATNTWTTLSSMSKKESYFHTEVIDKVIYVIGGMNDTSMESYVVSANATK